MRSMIIPWLLAIVTSAAAQTPNTQQALSGLQDATPEVRERSFMWLQQRNALRPSPSLALALARALRRDYQLIHDTYEKSNGESSPTDVYGEGYGEYVAFLSDACAKMCDLIDSRTVRLLASGPFVTAQAVADVILNHHASQSVSSIVENALHGKYGLQPTAVEMLGRLRLAGRNLTATDRDRLDSALIECVKSSSGIVPRLAIPSAVLVVKTDASMSDARPEQYHEAIVAGAQSAFAPVREAAADALAAFHDPADRALLSQLAAMDTARNVNHGKLTYPVREAAQRSLSALTKPR